MKVNPNTNLSLDQLYSAIQLPGKHFSPRVGGSTNDLVSLRKINPKKTAVRLFREEILIRNLIHTSLCISGGNKKRHTKEKFTE